MRDQKLAEAVVTFVAQPCPANAASLKPFSDRQWNGSMHWLVTSGLALPMFAGLRECGAESCLAPRIHQRLSVLDERSAVRTIELRHDFLSLNREFAARGVEFANWKGFALEPEFCPDIRLRPQMDFDFIMADKHAELADAVLRDAGYELVAKTSIERIYENLPCQHYSFEQVHFPKPHRKVEVHFSCDHPSQCLRGVDLRPALGRRRVVPFHGEFIPVLSREDAFLSHAAHAGRHALEGWLRLGWLLELDEFIRFHADNVPLWHSVERLSESYEDARSAAAVGILLANRVLRRSLPGFLLWSENALPSAAARWIADYGPRLAMADFPGTKLNLLLQREMVDASTFRTLERKRAYLPWAIPSVGPVPPNASLLRRVRAAQRTLDYITRRMRFHFIEGLRYALLKRKYVVTK